MTTQPDHSGVLQHFNNEKFEVEQYDKSLSQYEAASIKIATSLAYLNSGQNVIFSSALTAMMVLAAQGIIGGAFLQLIGLYFWTALTPNRDYDGR